MTGHDFEDPFGERHPVLAWLSLGGLVVASILGMLWGFGVIG